MPLSAYLQLAVATATFVAAASLAKAWAQAPSLGTAIITLGLYTFGNLLMLGLVRLMGMAVAFSLSAVLQLAAVNLLAVFWFGETLTSTQTVGIALALVAVVLVSLGPSLGR